MVMDENTAPMGQPAFEERSRALFDESIEHVDSAIRSRLTQARYAALEAAARSGSRPWFLRAAGWTPAAGVAAALCLGVALWMGALSNHGLTGDGANLDDLDIVAASDGGSVDALDMLQDDLDFYDFADKSTNPDPAA
jgi:hypothetical protein